MPLLLHDLDGVSYDATIDCRGGSEAGGAMESTNAPNIELMSALSTLLEAGKYSDLTIKCGLRTFAVHRAIICSRSGFFDGACSNPFREAESGIIDLSEDDEEAVEYMINYFYHLDYLPNLTAKRRSRGLSVRSNRSNVSFAPSAQPAQRPSSPTKYGRKKLNLAFVEDPLLAAASYTALSPTAQEPNPEEAPQLQANPLPAASIASVASFPVPTASTPPTAPGSIPASASHSRVSSVGSNFSVQQDLSAFSKLSLKQPPPDSAVGDLDLDRLDEFDFEQQEPNVKFPYLVTHCKVYAIAEKYGIAGLKALARAKFASQMSHHFESSEFADAIQDVYDSTVDEDRGLRDIVIQSFRDHPQLAQRKDVELAVKETPSLAWELFRVGWGLPVV